MNEVEAIRPLHENNSNKQVNYGEKKSSLHFVIKILILETPYCSVHLRMAYSNVLVTSEQATLKSLNIIFCLQLIHKSLEINCIYTFLTLIEKFELLLKICILHELLLNIYLFIFFISSGIIRNFVFLKIYYFLHLIIITSPFANNYS